MNGLTSTNNNRIKIQTRLFKYIFSNYFYRIAFRNWSKNEEGSDLSSQSIKTILNSTWEKYESKIIGLERQGSLGNWLVMNFAYLTLSAYQVMVDNGTEKEAAIGRIQELTWDISSTWTIRAKRLTKYIFQNQVEQVN